MPERIPQDRPRAEILQLANETLQEFEGRHTARVYFKFTCQHCGQRCTLAKPNILYASAPCSKCNKEQVIEKAGFMLVLITVPEVKEGASE